MSILTNTFIKQSVLRILGTKTYFTAEQFVRNWDAAGQVLDALAGMDYKIEIVKAYDGEYAISATRWNFDEGFEGTAQDYVFTHDEILSRGIMKLLIKTNAS